jgi:NAD(P)-dependent dehydrogenase (short-subunit alcohol dehydrogenase family)
MRLKNKLVVITAAASGMGRAGVELFVREGASVVAVDIDAARLDEVAKGVRASGGRVHTLVADLTQRQQAREVVDEAARLLGGIDILWANAGIPGPAEVEGLDLSQYDQSIELNVTAPILATAAVVSHMRKRGGGSIVFTASISGIRGSQMSPTYSAAKFAVVGFAKSAALKYAREGIRINAICPGMTQTAMLNTFLSRKGEASEIERNSAAFLNATPLGRMARPEEVAHAALWLASDDASFVTGTALPVDGGLSAR